MKANNILKRSIPLMFIIGMFSSCIKEELESSFTYTERPVTVHIDTNSTLGRQEFGEWVQSKFDSVLKANNTQLEQIQVVRLISAETKIIQPSGVSFGIFNDLNLYVRLTNQQADTIANFDENLDKLTSIVSLRPLADKDLKRYLSSSTYYIGMNCELLQPITSPLQMQFILKYEVKLKTSKEI